MNVKKALENFLEIKPVIVDGATFATKQIDEVKLESGDRIYWIYDGGDSWLSLDPDSDEVILFNRVEEEVDVSAETTVYNGDDYEFSFEGDGTLIDDTDDGEKVIFKDFESGDGTILRVSENMVTGEVITSIGQKITEEQLQAE